MASQPSQLIKQIELFVDSACSQTQQSASVDAVASLLKNDTITIEQLVREMEMYLTTTDNILRARGVLFLSEVIACLSSKPLDNATIHSLVGFFIGRLSDWRALRGALVGCLALVKRKNNVGMVTGNDARALAQSYLQNLVVQSLGQHDRMLCFELLQCLLDCFPEEAVALDDHLVYGVCEAIDGEKDPQCLMLTFRIVEVLAGLFPDPAGPIASIAEDLFDILGRYFPIHYTHPKIEDIDVSRDDLSRALMLAFSSSPFFEPFAIPLLLEKLSSSLPLAKVDSLKCLSYCAMKYGPQRMGKHAEAIWQSLKDAIQYLPEEPVLSSASDLSDNMGLQENEITKEALVLVQNVISQPSNAFLNLILDDEDINGVVNSIHSFGNYNDIPLQSKQKLVAVGHILSILGKTSSASCNRVFETIFVCLLDTLGVPPNSLMGGCFDRDVSFRRLNFGALYLSIQIIGACRDLAVDLTALTSHSNSVDCTWYSMLTSSSNSLVNVFSSNLLRSTKEKCRDPDILLGVKGLQILATFPGGSLLMSKSIFENVLMTLVSIVTLNFNITSLWKSALKALAQIGSFIDSYQESEKSQSYEAIVVQKILSLISMNECTMPFSLILEAISDISMTRDTILLKIVQVMEETIVAWFSGVYVDGDLKLAGNLVQLFDCYSNKLLPRIHEIGGFEGVPLHFAVHVWEQIQEVTTIRFGFNNEELLNATMVAMKLAVASCSEEDQHIIVEKSFGVISLSEYFLQMKSMSSIMSAQVEGLQLIQNSNKFDSRDDWVLSLFAAVIIALRPQTTIPDTRATIQTFITALLRGHVSSAQALGSMVNKMQHKVVDEENCRYFTLEDALELIFGMSLWSSNDDASLRSHGIGENGGLSLNMTDSALQQTQCITGLAWIGKGLLMRGHVKAKDITMIFLRCLLSGSDVGDSWQKQSSLDEGDAANLLPLMKSAADAFHILMSDYDDCLDKRFHATVRPLYKQRLFSTLTPIFLSSITKAKSSLVRSMLYRAFGHIICDTPLVAVLSETRKLVRVLLDALSVLSEDVLNKDVVYNLLLVLSAILMDKSGQDVIVENALFIINCLTQLISYPHKMLVRETAIQCLVAMSGIAHTRIYPIRTQVLRAVSKALDDPKRAVRQEAVRCWKAWASIA
ncbi:hypothetical protein Nepgr_005555 [Nepenthes gracilis]|uniref:MMS19 nucleotide excision repair protein n=1 Tax=Nepenthes gracilis TaxID=150966 RepID=A0AAD3S3I8_NEPGR|nr:hypothetical protein Nepgr_005555 [Nepenthes gracilis]